MRRTTQAGFTLIELLVVVVIIGILAAIAVPKYAATRDKARLASVRSDLRNIMTAQEAYWADNTTFATIVQLQAVTNFTLSPGNSAAMAPTVSGYTATITNSTITAGATQCQVQVGAGAVSTLDGLIVCS